MNTIRADRFGDEIVLVARFALVTLYLVFGWDKLNDYWGTAAYMTQVGAPMPSIAALIAIVVEIFAALAVALGVFTRPLAILMALYTLGTGLIGHSFWVSEGTTRYSDTINFYKNISIIGGFLLLYVTGPGRYSLEAMRGRPEARALR
jgi:putative oxidoreductase